MMEAGKGSSSECGGFFYALPNEAISPTGEMETSVEITVPSCDALPAAGDVTLPITQVSEKVSSTASQEVAGKIHVEPLLCEGPPIIVPAYDLKGPGFAAYPQAIEPVRDHLRAQRDQGLRHVANEINDHTYAEQLAAAQNCIAQLGDRLGVDVTERLVDSDHFHFYAEDQYTIARSRLSDGPTSRSAEYGNQQEGVSTAVQTAAGHILASVVEGDVKGTLGNANHELIHVASYNEVDIEVTPGESGGNVVTIVPRGSGYSNERTGAFDGFTEALTEITNIGLMENEWPQDPLLAPLTSAEYKNVGYSPQLILVSDILETRFDDPKAALEVLQQGMFTGSRRNLRILHQAIGTEGMGALARMSNSVEVVARTAELLDMPDTARKIRENDQTGLLDWLKPGRSPDIVDRV